MRGARLILWVALATLLLAACGAPEPWRREGFVFGTRIELLIVGASATEAEDAAAEVMREFDRLHRAYHAWQPSEVTALNQAIADGSRITVSAELAGLLRDAKALSQRSDGLFDPGIGALIGAWGFQNDDMPTALPRSSTLDGLVTRHPSITDLTVDGDRVSCRNRAVAIDFGGYLKGVALDRAAAILRAKGVANALINIGGNIMALGTKAGRPWRVGIQHPRPATSGGGPLATLDLHDGEAIGTSGDYHRYFEVDGKRYFHVLDPRTGRPAFGTWSATVLMPAAADAGALSDALSKPVFVAGDAWPDMARRVGASHVMRVSARGTVELTAAMKQRLSFDAADLRIVVRD